MKAVHVFFLLLIAVVGLHLWHTYSKHPGQKLIP